MSSDRESEGLEMLELQVETDEEEEFTKDEDGRSEDEENGRSEDEEEDNGRNEEDEEEDNGRSEEEEEIEEEEEDTKDKGEEADSDDDNLDLTLMQPVPRSSWHIVWSNDGSYVFCNLATKALEWEVPADLVGRDDVQDIIAKGPVKGPQQHKDRHTEGQEDAAMEDSNDEEDEEEEEDFLGFEDVSEAEESPSKNSLATLGNTGSKLEALNRERKAEKETRATKEDKQLEDDVIILSDPKPGQASGEQLIYDEYHSDIESEDLMSETEEMTPRPQSQSVEHKHTHESRFKRHADEQKNGESTSSESEERKKRKQPEDDVSEQDNESENDGVRERRRKRKLSGSKLSSQSECVEETTSPKRRDQRGSLITKSDNRKHRHLRTRPSSVERDSDFSMSSISSPESSPKRDWNNGVEQKRLNQPQEHKRLNQPPDHKRFNQPPEHKRSYPSVARHTKQAEFSCVEELNIYNSLSGREKKSLYTQTLQDFQDTRGCFNDASREGSFEDKIKAYIQYRKAKGDYYRLKLCMWIEKSAARVGDKSSALYQKFLDTTMAKVSRSNVLSSTMPSNASDIPGETTNIPFEIYSYEDVEEERKWDAWLSSLGKDVDAEVRRSSEVKSSARKNDGKQEDDQASSHQHQDLSKKKDLDANLQLLASTEASDVVPMYYQRAAEGQVLLERCSEPLLGVQYVVEVRRDSSTSLAACVFICVMCTKRLNSTMLLSHLQSVPHKLKFAELHYPEEYEQYKAFTSEMWTPAKIKKFNADIDKVDMKKGHFKLAVASEKNMTIVLAAIKENIRVIRSGGELAGKEEVVVDVEEKSSPDPEKEKAKPIKKAKDNNVKNYWRAAKRLSSWYQDAKRKFKREPDLHPNYREEWKRFWRARHKELKAEGKSSRDANIEREWTEFWIPRMAILLSNNYDDRKKELMSKFNLKENDIQTNMRI